MGTNNIDYAPFIIPPYLERRRMSVEDRFMSWVMPEPNTGCWLWLGVAGSWTGKMWYGTISVNNRPRQAHRLSYELFVGKIPVGMIVRHKCDVPLCVNPEHLLVGTYLDNARDRDSRGRNKAPHSDHHWGAILKNEDIPRIRFLIKSGVPQKDIAKQLGVNEGQITKIKKGIAWRRVL